MSWDSLMSLLNLPGLRDNIPVKVVRQTDLSVLPTILTKFGTSHVFSIYMQLHLQLKANKNLHSFHFVRIQVGWNNMLHTEVGLYKECTR